ncbi:hypothetical protein OE88DRAFT_1657197 [Heliocybe sulcata]|uniref:Uncharacterized protein n=1 Tax=Heliocybe sulcata TaxID=5364 RepID=A0A5C3N3C4_9AGAM|nr:hypothetical protein OE88DRAFT_1657197 [Heliocybe sulcata]
MQVRVNNIIATWKTRLGSWRDIRNTKHLVSFPGARDESSPYDASIQLAQMQRRWTSSVKAVLPQDQYSLSTLDIPPAAKPRRRYKNRALLLLTLHRTLLHEDDFMVLSGEYSKSLRFLLAPEMPPLKLCYSRQGQDGVPLPFPSDTQGFLYWHAAAPALASQVRFRITDSSDMATFTGGRDLRLPDCRPWNISVFDIASNSRYSGLRAHVLFEELVTDNILDTSLSISTRVGARVLRPRAKSLLIWKFGQSFLVDFRSSGAFAWVIGSSTGEVFQLQRLFSVWASESGITGIVKRVHHKPFTGRALVQFERSALPEHTGTRTVILRIVEVIEVAKSEGSDNSCGMPEPQEGGLVMTRTHGRLWVPWSVDVDRSQPDSGSPSSLAKALAILFDNEALQAHGAPANHELVCPVHFVSMLVL